jgi:hypothetical protein
MSEIMMKQYDEVMRGMKMEWPALKTKLLTGDEKVYSLMQEYYDAFLVYDAVMEDRKGELRHLNRAYGKLMNCIYGPIMIVDE